MQLVCRVLSVVKRGLSHEVAIPFYKFLCTKPPISNPLLNRLLQEPISRIKTALDSEDGFNFKTFGFSWDALLTALKSSSPQKAHLVLEWRLEKLLKDNERDHDSYCELISLCGKIQNVSFAMHVFTSMEDNGIKPNSAVFNALISACLSSVESELTRALYVFGDSAVECGTNTHRNTYARANYPPYGVDFLTGASGRFSNSLTVVDYFAVLLEAKVPVSIYNPIAHYNETLQGINYASASAGILPETGRALGRNINLKKQVKLFRKYSKSLGELKSNLSKDFFLIHIGGDDYLNNFLQPRHYKSCHRYNAEQFGKLLVNELATNLKDLYKWGARKFVLFEIAPLGCFPQIVKSKKPKTQCAEGVNNLVSIFNKKLALKVEELRSTLEGSTFVVAETYKLIYDMVENPAQYGFKDTKNSCCIVGPKSTGLCLPNKTPCQHRETYLFWDSLHLVDEANWIISRKCFDKTAGVAKPSNVLKAPEI